MSKSKTDSLTEQEKRIIYLEERVKELEKKIADKEASDKHWENDRRW
jgi:hypothetical protein